MKKSVIIVLLSLISTFLLLSFSTSSVYHVEILDEGYTFMSIEGNELDFSKVEGVRHFVVIEHNISLDYLPNDRENVVEHFKLLNNSILKKIYWFPHVDFYVSLLGPFIEFEVENIDLLQNEIMILSQKEFTKRLYLRRQVNFESEDNTKFDQAIMSMPPENDDGGGGYEYSYNKTIRIGMMDGGRINTDYPIFSDINIHEYNSNAHPNGHATAIAATIASTFGNNNRLSIHNIPHFETSYISAMEWLILDAGTGDGVDVINLSLGINNFLEEGIYGIYSRYTDFVVHQYKIPIVSSSGNSGNYPNIIEIIDDVVIYGDPMFIYRDKITAPAQGFNVIAVGGINSNDSFYTYSRYKLVNESSNSKPNIADYNNNLLGEGIGTSFSSAKVAARIGKVISFFPYLESKLEILYSAIHSSSNISTVTGLGTSSIDQSGLNNKIGAGLIDENSFKQLIRYQNFEYITNITNTSGIIYSRNIYILSNQTAFISIYSFRKVVGDTAFPITDYSISLYQNGVELVKSIGMINIEMIRYKAIVTGSYQIVVKQNAVNGNTIENIGLTFRVQY